MPINLRGNTIPDGSITSNKLADNAVIESKIATDAVTTTKISDDAVTTDKVTADLGIQHFLGSEVMLSVTGTTETSVAEFNFTKSSTTTESWKSLGYAITLYSNDNGNTATLKIYIDNVLFATEGTTSTTPFFTEDDAVDISGLSNGNHLVEVKLNNDQVTGIATTTKMDVYLGKKTV